MSLEGQRIQPDRYTVIPRTLCFLIREHKVLLIRIPEARGAWSGLLNGVGGHIEKGEDPYTSAHREIIEETGLVAQNLKLCGVIIVDSSRNSGIGIYIYVGTVGDEPLKSSTEGSLQWVHLQHLDHYKLVEDLPILLPRALQSFSSGEPFSGLYHYDEQGNLKVQFNP